MPPAAAVAATVVAAAVAAADSFGLTLSGTVFDLDQQVPVGTVGWMFLVVSL